MTTDVITPVNIEERKKLGIRPGDTVRVYIKVQEKGKTRLQPFEGLVLARKHGDEPGATFTVRRVSGGVGIEKIFPLYSPNIDRIEIIRRAKVRRAKLYYIREKAARQMRRQLRNMQLVNMTTTSDIAEKEAAAKQEEEEQQKAEEAEVADQQQEERPEENGGEEPKETEPETPEEVPATEPETAEEPADEGSQDEEKSEEEKKRQGI